MTVGRGGRASQAGRPDWFQMTSSSRPRGRPSPAPHSRTPVTPRSCDPCVTALAMWSKRVLGLERGVVSRRSDGAAYLVEVCCHSRTSCTYYGSIAPRNESQAPRGAAEESRVRGAGMHKNGRVRMRPCEDRGKRQDKSGQPSWQVCCQSMSMLENSTCGQAERTRLAGDQGMAELHGR